MIDYIYFTATSTNSEGIIETTEAYFYLPFLDFLLVFLVIFFGLWSVNLFYNLIYKPKKLPIDLKNTVRIGKKSAENFF